MRNKYFLDTSYLLSFCGINPSIPNFEIDFATIIKSRKIKFLFSSISFIELRYLVEKQIRLGYSDELRTEYHNGMIALTTNEQMEMVPFVNPIIAKYEIEILNKYLMKDYFDRIIMSSSITYGCPLISEDKKIKKYINNYSNSFHDTQPIRTWNKFKDEINIEKLLEETN